MLTISPINILMVSIIFFSLVIVVVVVVVAVFVAFVVVIALISSRQKIHDQLSLQRRLRSLRLGIITPFHFLDTVANPLLQEIFRQFIWYYLFPSSNAKATSNIVCSSKCLLIICNPKGSPSLSNPLGTEIAGKPAKFTGIVKTSFR